MSDKEFHADFVDRLKYAVALALDIKDPDARGLRAALARELTVKESTVQRWFKGGYPSTYHFTKIYERLGITPNQLLGIDQPVEPGRVQLISKALARLACGNYVRPPQFRR